MATAQLSAAMHLLLVLYVALLPALANSCASKTQELMDILTGPATSATLAFQDGCHVFDNLQSYTPISKNTSFSTGASNASWDMGGVVHLFQLAKGTKLTISNLTLLQARLAPPAWQKFHPLAFNVLDGGKLSLRNTQVVTYCDSLYWYLEVATTALQPGSQLVTDGSSYLYVVDYTQTIQQASGSFELELVRVNFTCNPSFVDTNKIALDVHSEEELVAASYTMTRLAMPVTYTLHNDIVVTPGGWPNTTIACNHNVTIQGPEGAAPPVFDTNARAALFRVNGAYEFRIQNIILNNLRVAPWQLTTKTPFLVGSFPVWFVQLDRTGPGKLKVVNSTAVLPPWEPDTVIYWSCLYNALNPRLTSYADWMRTRVSTLFAYRSPGSADAMTEAISSISTNYTHVLFTSKPPPGHTQVPAAVTLPPNLPGYVVTPEPLLSAYNHTQVLQALANPPPPAVNPTNETFPELPVVVSLMGAADFTPPSPSQPASARPDVVTIRRSFALLTPQSTPLQNSQQQSSQIGTVVPNSFTSMNGKAATLSLADLAGTFQFSSPDLVIWFQSVMLVNFTAAVPEGNAIDSAFLMQLSVFEFDRSKVQIFLDDVTLLLPRSQFMHLSSLLKHTQDEPWTIPNSLKGTIVDSWGDNFMLLTAMRAPGVQGQGVVLKLDPTALDTNLVISEGVRTSGLKPWQQGVIAVSVVAGVVLAACILWYTVLRKRRSLEPSGPDKLRHRDSAGPSHSSRYKMQGGFPDGEIWPPMSDKSMGSYPVTPPAVKSEDASTGSVTVQMAVGMDTSNTMEGSQGKLPSHLATQDLLETNTASTATTTGRLASDNTDSAAAASSSSHPASHVSSAKMVSNASSGKAVSEPSGSSAHASEPSSTEVEAPSGPTATTSQTLAAALPEPLLQVQVLASELSGSTTEHLRILEPIGQGGYGTVYKGIWRNLEVAVKTVLFQDRAAPPHSGSKPSSDGSAADTNSGAHAGSDTPAAGTRAGQHQQAIIEAAVCSSIAHPNVVATYHYDVAPVSQPALVGKRGLVVSENPSAGADWKLYLIQEYCDGGALSDVFDRRQLHAGGVPDVAAILSILLDIANGMKHIHSKNVIHGDLTPSNILLKREPHKGQPWPFTSKIADFGLCAPIAPGKSHMSNVRNGTPFYTAPEVVSNGVLTKSSDVYSFGVIMWELYTGLVPFKQAADGTYAPSPNFPRFPQHTPLAYTLLTHQCLTRNPKARPTFDTIFSQLLDLQSKFMASLMQAMLAMRANPNSNSNMGFSYMQANGPAASSNPSYMHTNALSASSNSMSNQSYMQASMLMVTSPQATAQHMDWPWPQHSTQPALWQHSMQNGMPAQHSMPHALSPPQQNAQNGPIPQHSMQHSVTQHSTAAALPQHSAPGRHTHTAGSIVQTGMHHVVQNGTAQRVGDSQSRHAPLLAPASLQALKYEAATHSQSGQHGIAQQQASDSQSESQDSLFHDSISLRSDSQYSGSQHSMSQHSGSQHSRSHHSATGAAWHPSLQPVQPHDAGGSHMSPRSVQIDVLQHQSHEGASQNNIQDELMQLHACISPGRGSPQTDTSQQDKHDNSSGSFLSMPNNAVPNNNQQNATFSVKHNRMMDPSSYEDYEAYRAEAGLVQRSTHAGVSQRSSIEQVLVQ